MSPAAWGGGGWATAALAYGGALAFGAALVAWLFPLDFLLARTDLVSPPSGDQALQAIAQRYFIADAWRWPVLVAGNIAAPEGVNIGFADAVPLEAMLLKLAAAWLPPGFHGINLWYGLAWLLQPVAAVWCLRGTGERRLLPALAVAVAAAGMPAWWNRYGHAALCAHFLILLGLGSYFRLVARPARPRPWAGAAALASASLLVHPYLAVMVLAVLAAVPLTLLARRVPGWRSATFGFGVVAVTLAAVMAAGGYLGARGGPGFGLYALNLLSPVWPAGSSLLPVELDPLPAFGGNTWEGYNYLGAGVLLGSGAVLLHQPRAAWGMVRRHAGLAAALAGLTLVALSQRVMGGPYLLLDLGEAPRWIENLRASGRFFWPLAYALLTGVVVLAARWRDTRAAGVLLALVAGLQFADVAEMRRGLRYHLAAVAAGDEEAGAATWRVDVPSLREALGHHRTLTLLPSWNCIRGGDPATEQALLVETLLLASERAVPASSLQVARWRRTPRCRDEGRAAAPLAEGELRVITPGARSAYLQLVPDAAGLCRPIGELTACSSTFPSAAAHGNPSAAAMSAQNASRVRGR